MSKNCMILNIKKCISNSLCINLYSILILIFSFTGTTMGETHCWKRKYLVSPFTGPVNATAACPQFYQWTINDYCCYDGYGRFDVNPHCCRSETYKLLIAVGLICLTVISAAFFLFLCWIYNLPHHILRILTCGKFKLNDYIMKSNLMTGPYVDPSFYAGEPFWTVSGAELPQYPLRPMPPRIFYPAVPTGLKGRWTSQQNLPHGQMPLFVLASRQFTRNPYSARPRERVSASSSISGPSSTVGNGQDQHQGTNSRRSSTQSSGYENNNNHSYNNKFMPSLNFKVHIDEVEAAAELLEALKNMEEKGDKAFTIPKLMEETRSELDLDLDLDLPRETIDKDVAEQKKELQKLEKEFVEITMDLEDEVHHDLENPTKMTLPLRSGSGNLHFPNPQNITLSFQSRSFDSSSSTSSLPYALESILEENTNTNVLKNTQSLQLQLQPQSSDDDDSDSLSNEECKNNADTLPNFIPDNKEETTEGPRRASSVVRDPTDRIPTRSSRNSKYQQQNNKNQKPKSSR